MLHLPRGCAQPLWSPCGATVAVRRHPEREERVVRPRILRLAPVVLLLAASACSSGGPTPAASESSSVRFASYDFAENQILAEVYAEAARRAGVPVSVQHGVGTREEVLPALEQGVVDVVIDYVGTALSFTHPSAADLPRVPEEMHGMLQDALGGRGVTVLDAA